jgi:hypothetical protein
MLLNGRGVCPSLFFSRGETMKEDLRNIQVGDLLILDGDLTCDKGPAENFVISVDDEGFEVDWGAKNAPEIIKYKFDDERIQDNYVGSAQAEEFKIWTLK